MAKVSVLGDFRVFFRVFEVKFTWGKPMIHVEQKNILKKRGKKHG